MKNLFFKRLTGFSLIVVMSFMTACSGGSSGTVESNGSVNSENTNQTSNVSKEEGIKYPTGDMTILVPFAAGGVNDMVSRQIASVGKEHFGKPTVVVNRPGGAGTVGATEYIQEKANTNKLMLATRAMFVTVPLVQKTQFTFDDFEPIIGIENVDFILYTNPKKTGIDSIEKLIEYGKTHRIKYGTTGPGSDLDLIQAGLFAMTNIESEAVVYGSGSEAVNSAAAGHIDVAVGPPGAGITLMNEGNIVPIAVAGPEPYKGFNEITVPTLVEKGFDISYPGLNFFAIRKGTDEKNIQFLHDKISDIYETEEFKELVANIKIDFKPLGPDEIKKYFEESTQTANKLNELIEK